MKSALVAVFIAGVFIFCTWFSLGTRLSEDDIMNLNFAWLPSWQSLAFALVVPFTHFYRPAGSLLYRLIFDLFGVNFLPFRIAIMLLMLANIYLVYCLAQRLSQSREVGAMSALLYSFHGRLIDLYRNTGTLFDVLCATLSLSTLLWYVAVRQQGRTIHGWDWLKFLVLFITALNAKEMAGAIPILLLVYELIWFRRLTVKTAAPALVAGVLTALAAYGRTSFGSVLYGNPGYAMTFTFGHFTSHWGELLNAMLYRNEPGLAAWAVGSIFLLLFAIALIGRRKDLWFSLAFALLGPLPVIFIPWRGFFVMCLPWAGWAMFMAIVLVDGRNWLRSRVRPGSALPANPFEPERLILFVAVTACIVWLPRAFPAPRGLYYEASQRTIRVMKNDLVRAHCPLPKGARILFLHDIFPADSLAPLELTRLVYRDRTLRVDRPTLLKTPPDPQSYDAVFDYRGRDLVVVRTAAAPGKRLRWPKS